MAIPSLESLTIEQRIKLLTGKDYINLEDLDGVLPLVCITDGPCGVNHPRPDDKGNWNYEKSILYPAPVVVANSWDRNTAKTVGECMADDCIEKGTDVLLAFGINIKRLPTCGRNFEYYSEDPLLSGVMGYECMSGVQARNVGATLKHYCANNSDYDRMYQSSEIDERTLREIYLPAFEIALKCNPYMVMSSYNKLNGKWLSENKKMVDHLRGELGYKGVVVSDWLAVHNPVNAVKAGTNIEMPHNDKSFETILSAYKADEISEAEINASAQKVLELYAKVEEDRKVKKVKYTFEERKALAQKSAEQGIVLLKNDGGVLPLKDGASVAVSGYIANSCCAGGGSALIKERYDVKALDACLKDDMPNSEIFFDGCTINDRSFSNMRLSVEKAMDSDVAIVAVGTGYDVEMEGFDRTNLRLNKVQEDLIHEIAKVNPNTVVVLYAGSAIDMSSWIDEVKAVVFAGFSGQMAHEAVSAVISGKVNPSGKLSETFPYALEDVPAYNMPANYNVARYLEGLDVGYRYFVTADVPVLFPFGYGLSYSKFEYCDLTVNKVGEYDVEVSVKVTNTSKIDGAEVVQIYVKDVFADVYRPAYELRAFDKKFIKAGESETFTFKLDKRAFAYYSVAVDEWIVEPGKFDILIGASCLDIKLSQRIEL